MTDCVASALQLRNAVVGRSARNVRHALMIAPEPPRYRLSSAHRRTCNLCFLGLEYMAYKCECGPRVAVNKGSSFKFASRSAYHMPRHVGRRVFGDEVNHALHSCKRSGGRSGARDATLTRRMHLSVHTTLTTLLLSAVNFYMRSVLPLPVNALCMRIHLNHPHMWPHWAISARMESLRSVRGMVLIVFRATA